ncbi:MAG: hypothetical protein CHH17_16535 [Candidatus Fluviicola riflensis]|nr:MAG: hypothetical protein CHH17_16535 [Candidatus Fluviicola riflensis]
MCWIVVVFSGGQTTLQNGVALCKKCHKEIHK